MTEEKDELRKIMNKETLKFRHNKMTCIAVIPDENANEIEALRYRLQVTNTPYKLTHSQGSDGKMYCRVWVY